MSSPGNLADPADMGQTYLIRARNGTPLMC